MTKGASRMSRTVVAGIAGGSGSGKTTLVQEIVRAIGTDFVGVVSHDSYYRDLRALSSHQRSKTNFDDPSSLETELLLRHVELLKRGEEVQVPVYDFSTHTRSPQTRVLRPKPILIVDGVLILADKKLRNSLDLCIYVDTPEEIRLARRLSRDRNERGRTTQNVMTQFWESVKPMHDAHVEPSRVHADITVIGQGREHPTRRNALTAVQALLRIDDKTGV